MKNIIIKINEAKTISIKNYLLELLSQKKFNVSYLQKRDEINSFIRAKVKSDNLNSMETTKFITETLSKFDDEKSYFIMKIERLENQKIELENSYFLVSKKLENLLSTYKKR